MSYVISFKKFLKLVKNMLIIIFEFRMSKFNVLLLFGLLNICLFDEMFLILGV